MCTSRVHGEKYSPCKRTHIQYEKKHDTLYFCDKQIPYVDEYNFKLSLYLQEQTIRKNI